MSKTVEKTADKTEFFYLGELVGELVDGEIIADECVLLEQL